METWVTAQPAKALSAALGITQARLARVLHVSEPTMHRLLSGDRIPTATQAATVAEHLGLPEAELWRPERRSRARRTR